MRQIVEVTGIHRRTLTKFFREQGIPILSPSEGASKKWQDSEFRERNIVGSKQELARRWQDPEFRARNAAAVKKTWENPEFRARNDEGKKRKWQDPEYRNRMIALLQRRLEDQDFKNKFIEAARQSRQDPGYSLKLSNSIKQKWKNEEYKKKVSESQKQKWQDDNFRRKAEVTVRNNLQKVWNDPLLNQKRADVAREATRIRWTDPEYRVKHAEWTRRARLDPKNIGRYVLPTIYGKRGDLDNDSQSMWEANVERVLLLCKRQFLYQENFLLTVPVAEQQKYYLAQLSAISLDFLTLDNRGNFVAYEIMAHPLENPIGWLKVELFVQQYPAIRLVLITKEFYDRLRERFEERVNNNSNFLGWEIYQDNLRTNPQKWTTQQKES